jgi:hypothetical protein
MDAPRSVARNVITQHAGLSREVGSWLSEQLTDTEITTLSIATPTPAADTAKTIAADALTRAAEAIRPAVA